MKFPMTSNITSCLLLYLWSCIAMGQLLRMQVNEFRDPWQREQPSVVFIPHMFRLAYVGRVLRKAFSTNLSTSVGKLCDLFKNSSIELSPQDLIISHLEGSWKRFWSLLSASLLISRALATHVTNLRLRERSFAQDGVNKSCRYKLHYLTLLLFT